MRPVTRRAVLGGLLATPLLAACAGFDTSGAAAPGTVGFLSTQFTPVEERQRFEQVLRSQLPVPVAYNPVEGGVFTTTIKSQAQARNVRTALIGGLYNDLASPTRSTTAAGSWASSRARATPTRSSS